VRILHGSFSKLSSSTSNSHRYTLQLISRFRRNNLQKLPQKRRSTRNVDCLEQSGQGLGCYPVAPTSKLMIRVNNGKNSTVSVLIDSQLNLTWTNVGSSTIVKPPFTIENKLDFNLLNLTELVAKNYIQNNQTNVIVPFSNSHTVFGKTNCWLDQEYMSNGSHQIHKQTCLIHALFRNAPIIPQFKLANNTEVS